MSEWLLIVLTAVPIGTAIAHGLIMWRVQTAISNLREYIDEKYQRVAMCDAYRDEVDRRLGALEARAGR